jgi:hypothetical protein
MEVRLAVGTVVRVWGEFMAVSEFEAIVALCSKGSLCTEAPVSCTQRRSVSVLVCDHNPSRFHLDEPSDGEKYITAQIP